MNKICTALCGFLLVATSLFAQTALDIAVSISATTAYQKYANLSLAITAKNVGNTAMTNVQIKFDQPAFTASGGSDTSAVSDLDDTDACGGGFRHVDHSDVCVGPFGGGHFRDRHVVEFHSGGRQCG